MEPKPFIGQPRSPPPLVSVLASQLPAILVLKKLSKAISGLEYLFFIITGIFSNETLLHPPSELVCIYSGSGSTTPEPLPVTDGANGYYAIKSTKRPNQWLGLFDVIYAS